MTRNCLRTAAALFATVLTLSSATAHEGQLHEGCPAGQTFSAGELTVSGAFTRATLPGAQVAGGYLVIENHGSAPDRLLGGETEAAGAVEVHEMVTTDGMMRMNALPAGLEVPAGGTVTLSPGGLHLMFLGVREPFAEGECIEVTLHFATAGELPVQLTIGGIGASAAPGHPHHH